VHSDNYSIDCVSYLNNSPITLLLEGSLKYGNKIIIKAPSSSEKKSIHNCAKLIFFTKYLYLYTQFIINTPDKIVVGK